MHVILSALSSDLSGIASRATAEALAKEEAKNPFSCGRGALTPQSMADEGVRSLEVGVGVPTDAVADKDIGDHPNPVCNVLYYKVCGDAGEHA